ncbi:hypothetical protein EDI_090960 [Entamoeba dispar SAW760]|uniref:Uncharacterized protein n=1 Tax=Entamoeba dispar (strain ATCC PRA-260 / SAW760) TaxID=370354 RepID=B0EDJ6_ENTDS|nr:uncharacterized protein EDI_090960 [Entamoeba dispar SAW760]EDR27394.1 hypothetical protein EDI_090960 [Entamoeba dispar SAW760]|eukprot:EDR27394.1 hypothetical protein EDI_090960 [Entamoeba dispar SAW760]
MQTLKVCSYYSVNFFDAQKEPLEMNIFKNGKRLLVLATVRYFEIKVYGLAVMEARINWIHSDDGKIFIESGIGKPYGPPYGISEYESHIFGFGYGSFTKEIFFTRDGIKLPSLRISWSSIGLGLAVKNFYKIELNYGQSEFFFDLFEYMESNGYLHLNVPHE